MHKMEEEKHIFRLSSLMFYRSCSWSLNLHQTHMCKIVLLNFSFQVFSHQAALFLRVSVNFGSSGVTIISHIFI